MINHPEHGQQPCAHQGGPVTVGVPVPDLNLARAEHQHAAHRRAGAAAGRDQTPLLWLAHNDGDGT
jgi:hypothetical protein